VKLFVRYESPVLVKLVEELESSQSAVSNLEKDLVRALCETLAAAVTSFGSNLWAHVVAAISHLDAHVALTGIADAYDWSVPVVQKSSENHPPLLHFVQVVNPVLKATVLAEMVPNTVSIGVPSQGSTIRDEFEGNECAASILLTGANMGGKSTGMAAGAPNFLWAADTLFFSQKFCEQFVLRQSLFRWAAVVLQNRA
jgi:DNA mismatch repair ATPase MutS